MNILTHSLEELYTSTDFNQLTNHIQNMIAPIDFTNSIKDYNHLMNHLSNTFHFLAITTLKNTLETMDYNFKVSEGRSTRYYVKQTRERTIITPFGLLTYTRTEYQNRHTKDSFCYVDRKIGLRKRERFDSCVQSMIYEAYSDSNSMIKVGEIIGDRLFNHYSTSTDRNLNAISRQTVYNILHRFNSIQNKLEQKKETPETLYIMADEKYIALQREKEKHKQMVKLAVIFEDCKRVTLKDNSPSKYRFELINKHYIERCNGDIWEDTFDSLAQLYDLKKVKQIYILGDGASWITYGAFKLSMPGIKVTFAIDRFHFMQAIVRITKDPIYKDVLIYYAYANMKEDFNQVINLVIEENPALHDKILKNKDYLNLHWNHFQIMNKQVKIGCGMEQAISHAIASSFTSVPKAYGINNLPTYLNSRINHLNQLDLRQLFLQAVDIQNVVHEDIFIQDEYDFSFFDNHSESTYSLNFKNRSNSTSTSPF